MACSCEGKGAKSKVMSTRYAVVQVGQSVDSVTGPFKFISLSAAENVRKKLPGATIEIVNV